MNIDNKRKRGTLTLKTKKDVDLREVAAKRTLESDKKSNDRGRFVKNNDSDGDKFTEAAKKEFRRTIERNEKGERNEKVGYNAKNFAGKIKGLNDGLMSRKTGIKVLDENRKVVKDREVKREKKKIDVIPSDNLTVAENVKSDKKKKTSHKKSVDYDLNDIFHDAAKKSVGIDDEIVVKTDEDENQVDHSLNERNTKRDKRKEVAVKMADADEKKNLNNAIVDDKGRQMISDYYKDFEKKRLDTQVEESPKKEEGDAAAKSWKLSLNHNVSDEERQRVRELMYKRQRRGRPKYRSGAIAKVKKVIKVEQGQTMSPHYLAGLMGEKNRTVESVMHSNQIRADRNKLLSFDEIQFIVESCRHELEIVEKTSLEDRFIATVRATKKEFSNEPEKFVKRTPVVTIMGHVDHGKTSLLDYFRNSRVIDGEAGGITQHIGAYKVQTKNGNDVTFLDTPGHEAFSKIRARGANVTDIVLLIVAADDGVMPQTIEAINHIKAAKVSMLVVVNKIDRPNINLEKLTMQLSQHEIISDEWGGENIFVKISAKTGENIDNLEENIVLQAEMAELKGNPEGNAVGVVLETKIHPKKGYCATLLIQKGELKVGDNLIVGTSTCTVRNLMNDLGSAVQSAAICEPVEVFGFDSLPESGEYFVVMDSQQDVRDLATARVEAKKKPQSQEKKPFDFFGDEIVEEKKTISFIVKADTQGSLDAIAQSIGKLETVEMEIKVVASGVGTLSNSDLDLAKITNSRVIVFNTKVDGNIVEVAKKSDIEVLQYNIIYNIIDDIGALINNTLGPRISENKIGEILIKRVFGKTKSGSICGCIVKHGIVKKLLLRVVRYGEVIYDNGSFRSLRREDEDVNEVRVGFECGLIVDNFFDAREGDKIEIIERIEEAR